MHNPHGSPPFFIALLLQRFLDIYSLHHLFNTHLLHRARRQTACRSGAAGQARTRL